MKDSFAVIYLIGAVIALLVIGMSLFFIRVSFRRARQIGMDTGILKQTIKSSVIFSLVPSIPIVIGIGIMMQYLGLALSWIRLEVIGALQYEILAMNQVLPVGCQVSSDMVAAALVVMTVSILSGPVFNALCYKRYENRLAHIRESNPKLMDSLTGALLGGLLSGLISAMLVGAAFSIGNASVAKDTGAQVSGEVTLITFGVSCLLMAVCGLLIKKWKWLESYAMAVTILGALSVAFFIA